METKIELRHVSHEGPKLRIRRMRGQQQVGESIAIVAGQRGVMKVDVSGESIVIDLAPADAPEVAKAADSE